MGIRANKTQTCWARAVLHTWCSHAQTPRSLAGPSPRHRPRCRQHPRRRPHHCRPARHLRCRLCRRHRWRWRPGLSGPRRLRRRLASDSPAAGRPPLRRCAVGRDLQTGFVVKERRGFAFSVKAVLQSRASNVEHSRDLTATKANSRCDLCLQELHACSGQCPGIRCPGDCHLCTPELHSATRKTTRILHQRVVPDLASRPSNRLPPSPPRPVRSCLPFRPRSRSGFVWVGAGGEESRPGPEGSADSAAESTAADCAAT